MEVESDSPFPVPGGEDESDILGLELHNYINKIYTGLLYIHLLSSISSQFQHSAQIPSVFQASASGSTLVKHAVQTDRRSLDNCELMNRSVHIIIPQFPIISLAL